MTEKLYLLIGKFFVAGSIGVLCDVWVGGYLWNSWQLRPHYFLLQVKVKVKMLIKRHNGPTLSTPYLELSFYHTPWHHQKNSCNMEGIYNQWRWWPKKSLQLWNGGNHWAKVTTHLWNYEKFFNSSLSQKGWMGIEPWESLIPLLFLSSTHSMSMVMVRWQQNHWKNIKSNIGSKKIITIPSS